MTWGAFGVKHGEHDDGVRLRYEVDGVRKPSQQCTANLAANLAWYRQWLAVRSGFDGENLSSLREAVERAEMRLLTIQEEPAYGVLAKA